MMPAKALSRRRFHPSHFIPARFLPESLRTPAAIVPVIRLYGAIGMGSFPGQPGLSLAGVAAQLESAFEVEDAKAVALLIKSPGGSPAQSHMIYQRIRALAAEHKRLVFAFIEDVGASGGYMLACAADEIFADPTSIVGSIGVVSAGFGFTGLIEKLGVERRVYTAGTSKAMLDAFAPERADDVARLKDLQADVHDVFINLVKDSRGDKLSGAGEDLFSGAFWTGRKAVELGLIDALGDVRSVMRERFGEKVKLKVVEAPSRGGLLRYLLPGLAAAPTLPTSLIDADGLIGALETRALWSRYGL
jgi:signal peptide peptidase SppA